MVLLYTCVLCMLVVVEGQGGRGTPPQLIKGNRWLVNPVYLREGARETYECQAKAKPAAKYRWTVNGMDIKQEADSVTFDPNSGTLTVGRSFRHEGDYQCIAFNEHGKSMSPFLTLIKATAKIFESGASSTLEEHQTSEYLKLTCEDVPYGAPPWNYAWQTLDSLEDAGDGATRDSSSVVNDERRVIDNDGNLHILWLKEEDSNIYACSVTNDVVLVTMQNTKSYELKVLPTVNPGRSALVARYHPDVTVHAGEDAILTCIFSYFSPVEDELVKIKWTKGSEHVGDGRSITVKTSGANFLSKEGEYICTAILGNQRSQEHVQLTIVEPPVFKANKSITAMMYKPLGKEYTFHCETQSRHSYASAPIWMINTEPLLGCPPRFFECEKTLSNGASQCIHESNYCNSFPDCQGEGGSETSDEKNCPTICLEGTKRCGDQCIPNDQPCNDIICKHPNFLCADKSNCFEAKIDCNGRENCFDVPEHCNGRADCPDGSDEVACPNGPEIVRQKFRFNSQQTQMTVPNLQMSDTMCIQCMVTNEFGTTFSDGCLAVIRNIGMLKSPNSTYDVKPGYNLTIDVLAETDPLFQSTLNYTWYYFEREDDNPQPEVKASGKEPSGRYLVGKNGTLPIPGLGRYFRLSLDNRHLEIMFPFVEKDDQRAYDEYYLMKDRTYYLNVSHGYDFVVKNFTIHGVEITKPKPKPVVDAASTNLWFIALILAILILFIVVALIVCYMYRNRGGTYPLDKKEHQAGHDPEQELKNNGFNDVGRIDDDDYDKPHGEEASLSESVKPYDDSDDDPTDEYAGDFDVSKFNEDGSFIGLYGDKKSKYSSEAKEATV